MPSQKGGVIAAAPMAPGDDVGRFLRGRVNELDKNAANMGGHDTLMVYHYEGGESEVSDVTLPYDVILVLILAHCNSWITNDNLLFEIVFVRNQRNEKSESSEAVFTSESE